MAFKRKIETMLSRLKNGPEGARSPQTMEVLGEIDKRLAALEKAQRAKK